MNAGLQITNSMRAVLYAPYPVAVTTLGGIVAVLQGLSELAVLIHAIGVVWVSLDV